MTYGLIAVHYCYIGKLNSLHYGCPIQVKNKMLTVFVSHILLGKLTGLFVNNNNM